MTKNTREGWERIPMPCDMCPRQATWRHPLGGLRCDRCPCPQALPHQIAEALENADGAYEADQPIPEDERIKAAHPTRSGRHGVYQVAMRLVGAKKSKASLVALVNWLLLERSDLGQLVLEALPYVEAVRARMPDRDSEKWAKWIEKARKATGP